MITRLFHAWERRLASVTTDRVVRGFEWGVDWLATDGAAAAVPGTGTWPPRRSEPAPAHAPCRVEARTEDRHDDVEEESRVVNQEP